MVSTISISSSHIPAAFSGFRIAQISDLHNVEFGKNNAELLKLLSESKPDIIVITGELIDANHTDVGIALGFAQESDRIVPTYYVTGKHEAASPQYDALQAGLKDAGVIVLEDEAISLERNGETITLLGLADPDFTVKGDMFGEVPAMVSTKLKNLIGDESGYTILFSHRPELFETYVDGGIDLVFSGHVHEASSSCRLSAGWLPPIKGCFPNLMLDCIQTAAQAWWSAVALETASYHSVSITARPRTWPCSRKIPTGRRASQNGSPAWSAH
uniref:metallophosphoesterase n=1 Tax=Parablautia muri TaxID=2320879 RepID=UPI002FE6E0CC